MVKSKNFIKNMMNKIRNGATLINIIIAYTNPIICKIVRKGTIFSKIIETKKITNTYIIAVC